MKSAPPPANSVSSAVTLPHLTNHWAEKVFAGPFSLPQYFLAMLLQSSAVAALRIAHSSGHAVLHPPQTPSQPLGELLPRAPQPRLQRVFRDPQLLGRLSRRKSLHLAQDKR